MSLSDDEVPTDLETRLVTRSEFHESATFCIPWFSECSLSVQEVIYEGYVAMRLARSIHSLKEYLDAMQNTAREEFLVRLVFSTKEPVRARGERQREIDDQENAKPERNAPLVRYVIDLNPRRRAWRRFTNRSRPLPGAFLMSACQSRARSRRRG